MILIPTWLLPGPTLVFNVNLLRLPELVLPHPLQRPCHQAVLRLDGIILSARSLRLVARSLAPERPLTFERAGFVLELAQCGNRESEAIRRQRFEQQSFDCRIDAQGAHLLTPRPAMLLLIGATKIDGVVAARAGIMQPHATAATATNGNALQQRIALARRPVMVCIIVIEVVREPPLVRHELLPIDISRKGGLQANRPILYRHGCGRALP